MDPGVLFGTGAGVGAPDVTRRTEVTRSGRGRGTEEDRGGGRVGGYSGGEEEEEPRRHKGVESPNFLSFSLFFFSFFLG